VNKLVLLFNNYSTSSFISWFLLFSQTICCKDYSRSVWGIAKNLQRNW